MALRINNSTAQGLSSNEFWNNYPVKTPYAVETGRQGSEVNLLDQRKMVININDNMRKQALRSLPMMKIFDKMSAGATLSKLMYTWVDKYDNPRNMKFLPFKALRTRDYAGTNATNTAWGTGANTDISNVLGSLNEVGGQLQFQKAYAKSVADSTVFSSALLAGALAGKKIYISSSAKGTFKTVADDFVQGIQGAMRENAVTPMTFNGKKIPCMVLAYGRGANDTQGRPEDLIWTLARELGARNYELNNAEGEAIEWVDGASGGVSVNNSGSVKTMTYTHVEGTSHMDHLVWDYIYTKIGAKLEGFANRLMGIKKFIFTSDLNKFIIIFDMSETNFPYLEMPDDTITSINIGQHYIVNEGTITHNSKVLVPGDIFKGVSTQALTAKQGIATIPTGFLIEEVNTAKYGTTKEHYNRMFMPAYGMASEGFSRIGNRLVKNYSYDMQASADASGSFDLSKITGGSALATEGRGKNFMEIFRSDVWGRTRLSETTDVEGGTTYSRDREENLETFYTAINAKLLMGKLDFGQSHNGRSPIDVFQYAGSAGLDGEYTGKVSGLLDYSTFQCVWAKMPFYMGKPGYNPRQSADLGFAVVEFCEKILSSMSWKQEFGKKTTYSALVSRHVVKTLGLTYAKNASAISEVGNPFGTEIRYNKPDLVDINVESFSYVGETGNRLNLIVDDSLDFAPKFKAPYFLLGKEKVDPRWLIIVLNKADVKVYSHKGFPDQVFVNLQPAHAVNVQYEGAQASRLLEVKNAEDQMIIDISPMVTM